LLEQLEDPKIESNIAEVADRFVLFLGFSEVATRWEADRTQPLIGLLADIAAMQSPFSIDGSAQEEVSAPVTGDIRRQPTRRACAGRDVGEVLPNCRPTSGAVTVPLLVI
jgi:hypothetical protein